MKNLNGGINWNMGRRNFLKLALGTGLAAGTGLSIPGFTRAETVIEEEAGKEVFTFCGVCSGNCSIKGYVKNGRLTHLVGNPHDLASGDPFDPDTGGRICVKAHSAIRTLYDPDRLKYPLKRTNPNKGLGVDPAFVKISWEEAINTAAEKLNQVIEEYGPESVLFFSRSNPYGNRLGRAIGTPNFISHQSTCFTTQEAAWIAMVTGGGRPWTYDVENCKYILSFGWDGLGKAKNMQVRNTTKALQRGAKLVVIDPFESITASKAHEWYSIKPGTDLAFCLAMINVIVTEKLYNREFVEKYTYGFEYLDEFAKEYTPEWASEITGIPADVIVKVAREFATIKPAHIFSHKRDAAGPNYANSTKLAQAQLILNTLAGTIDRRGGTILPRNPSMPGLDSIFPPPDYPEAREERIDAWERNNPLLKDAFRGNFATVAHGILSEDPYPARGGIVRMYNTLSFPNQKKMVDAFCKLDFLLVCEIYPAEIAQLADIVLPEPHWLESSGFSARGYHSLYPQIAVRMPVVEQLYNTKGYGTIIMELARAMGYGQYFQGVSGDRLLDEQLKAIGSSWNELANSPTGLWEDKKEFTPTERFNTPSGKIELYSTVFEKHGYDPLPTWEPRREEPSNEYPFNYLIGRPAIHKMTQTQNNPHAMEIYPENNAIMNTQTAREMGIKEGDAVYVESRVGKIKLKAKLTEGIRPDCVLVKHGFGHWSQDLTLAHTKGANDGDLIPDMTFEEMIELNDPGMGACMTDFCVKVYKA